MVLQLRHIGNIWAIYRHYVWKYIFYKYSVCSLVWHRREEQITGNIASQIFKQLSKLWKKGPRSCQMYSKQPSPPLPPPMVGGVLTKSRAAAASLALHQDFFAPSKPYFPISVQIIFLIWTENWNNGISNSFNQHCTHLSSVFVKAVNLIFTFQTWSFWALLHKSFCQSKEQVELLNIKSKDLLLLPRSDKRKFTL